MKTLYVNKYLSEIATTRLKAKELVSLALREKAEAISLKDIEFASRSFLHELITLTNHKNIELIDCNSNVSQLVKLIESNNTAAIAPVLDIKRAQPLKI